MSARNLIAKRALSSITPAQLKKFNRLDATFGVRYGPPGRAANSGITATTFGAYGFIGRYLLEELGNCGSRCYVPFRGCELEVRHLKVPFDLGQIGFIPFSPRDKDSVLASVERSDVVVNMIGKMWETKHVVPTRRDNGKLSTINYDFEETNVTIPKMLATQAKNAGVKCFIHVSSLAADENSECKWARTKALGEKAVREAFPEAIIVKLANVFGPEDRFLNIMAEVTAKLPAYPLVDGGEALTQPVYCVDVGKALMEIIQNHEVFEGQTFQLAGPAEYSYKELAEFVQDITMMKRPLVDVPASAFSLLAAGIELLPAPWITPDLIKLMQQDVLLKPSSSGFLTFDDLGMEPASVDKEAFNYLHRFRKGGHFTMVEGYH